MTLSYDIRENVSLLTHVTPIVPDQLHQSNRQISNFPRIKHTKNQDV